MTGLDLDLSQIGPIAARLGAATALGALVGLNRHLRRHPAGLRTHAVVALGAAAVTLTSITVAAGSADPTGAISRTIQGILTGIGFVGAGVVLHRNDASGVHGLTTAASVWLVAIVVFTVGGPIERACVRLLGRPEPRQASE